MDLNTVWFILIGVLYTGFFILEGFDFGVGILLPFLSKDKDPAKVDQNRRVMLNTIGPHWDGNEVWFLTAGGATFAAFPEWYATMFSGFYIALFLLLAALIFRGIAIEYRSKSDNPRLRNIWDWCIFFGSLVAPLLIVVALANILRGVPINADKQFVGNFFTLLNPYSLLAGVTGVAVFALYGAIFLSMKTYGEVRERAQAAVNRLWIVAVLLIVVFLVATYLSTDFVINIVKPGIVPVIGLVTILLTGYFNKKGSNGWAFITTAITIVTMVYTVFALLYPRVMVSSLKPIWSLTIYNASSSPYTLKVMTIVALIFVPIVLIYQGWSYWIFRKRLTQDTHLEY